MKNLKILIVDGSGEYRSLIEHIFNNETGIELVGSVKNGSEAISYIKSKHVDLVTMAIETLGDEGLQTLKKFVKIKESESQYNHNIGVIIISSFTNNYADLTIKALEAGGFDFVTKPNLINDKENIKSLSLQLIVKVRQFATKTIYSNQSKNRLNATPSSVLMNEKNNRQTADQQNVIRASKFVNAKLILIGVSTGGPAALMSMLPELSANVDLPILIVQHMPAKFTTSLATRLNSMCRHTVMESAGKETIQNNYIYLAPGGKHMLLKKFNNKLSTYLDQSPPENGCRPAADVLFRSTAGVSDGIIAIVLTGMGQDGTKGLIPLRQKGAYVIAQDQNTSAVWGMPGSAVKAGFVDTVLPLNGIPAAVRLIIDRSKR